MPNKSVGVNTEGVPSRKEEIRRILIKLLQMLAYQLSKEQIPYIELKTRTKNNIVYDPEKKTWVLGPKKVKKTCKTKGGSSQVLKLINLIELLLEQLDLNKHQTLRNMYYCAMNWHKRAVFEEVSDAADALECLEVLTGLLREELGIVPDLSGSFFGDIFVQTKTRAGLKRIHCTRDVSEAGFAIPPKIDDYHIDDVSRIKFVLVIETGGMYHRLIEDGFDQKYNCLLIHTKGQSSRATRGALRKIVALAPDMPVLGFCDGDPWGHNIMMNIATGSIKSSHLSERLCTPNMVIIGLYPSQIEEYNLPSVKLTPREIKRIDEMLDDPRYMQTSRLKKELLYMKEKGVKAEQQAFAIKGISFVTDTYIPTQLKKLGLIAGI